MSRDIAEKFNHHYGELFPVPEPLIGEDTGVIPGIDGRKMSKSYDNYIGLFESPKAVKKKIMRIVTDSKTVEDKKDPDTCNVFSLYRLFGSDDEIAELRDRYTAGGMGYGDAKNALLEVVEQELQPLRESYEDWMSRPDDIYDVLSDSAMSARQIASVTIGDVREAIGLGKLL